MDCNETSLVDQRNIDRTVEWYSESFNQLVKHASLSQIATLTTDSLDAVLCDSLGTTGATRYWPASAGTVRHRGVAGDYRGSAAFICTAFENVTG